MVCESKFRSNRAKRKRIWSSACFIFVECDQITMATPAAAPLPNISFKCTNMDELFTGFVKITSGSPLPSNVIDHINPYGSDPKNLPGKGLNFSANNPD